jgi:fibronectin-binding autotransporter adhesin
MEDSDMENALKSIVVSPRNCKSPRGVAVAHLLAASAAAVGLFSPLARGQTVYLWDPGQSGTGGTDGGGTWDATGNATDWFNTTPGFNFNPVPWSEQTTDTAEFGSGGVAGTVGVDNGVPVGSIIFNAVSSGNYLLTGGSLNFGSGVGSLADGITVAANTSPTIASNYSGASLNIYGPGTISLTGNGTITSGFFSVLSGTANLGTPGGSNTVTTNNEIAIGAGNNGGGTFPVPSPAGTSGSPSYATMNITSGTTVNSGVSGSYQNFGLGNGDVSDYQALTLNVNGTVNCAQFFTFYNAGSLATDDVATININSGGVANASSGNFGLTLGSTTNITVGGKLNISGTLYTTSTTNLTVNSGGSLTVSGGNNATDFGATNSAITTTVVNNGTITVPYTIYTGIASTGNAGTGSTSLAITNITNNGTLDVSNYNMRLGGIVTLANTGTLLIPQGTLFTYGPTTINNSGTMTMNGLSTGSAGGAGTVTFNLTGGVFTINNGGSINSTNGGTGTVTVTISSGATFTDNDYFYLSSVTGQTTTITQNGGTFNAASGGNNSNTNGMFFNHGTSSYSLNGGFLIADAVATQDTSSFGTFLFNGGTLESQATSGNGYPGGLNPGFFSPPTAQVGPSVGTFNMNAGEGTILLATTPITTATALGSSDGGITVTGGGTLEMVGANTYNGPTTVLGGTLILGNDPNPGFTTSYGSVNSSSGITINGAGAKFVQLSNTPSTPAIALTNGTIDGIGGVGSVTVAPSSTNVVTNGNGSTTFSAPLTMSSLTFNGAATENVLIAGGSSTTSPGQIVTSTLTTSAGLISVNVTAASLVTGDNYNLIQFAALAGTGSASFVLGAVTGGTPASQNYSLMTTASDLVLDVTATPEPSSLLMLFGGVVPLALKRRRRLPRV